jgi:hypothetical protein
MFQMRSVGLIFVSLALVATQLKYSNESVKLKLL